MLKEVQNMPVHLNSVCPLRVCVCMHVCVRVHVHSAPSSCMLENMACAQVCVFGERGAMREGGKERDKCERFESSNVKSPWADELVHVASSMFSPL